MNKQLATVVIVILALIGGGLAYLMLGSSDQSNQTAQISTDSAASSQQGEPQDSSASAGVYTAYQAEKVAATQGTKLLFFHAPWCPQCRKLEASIKASTIPQGVTIFKVDYDTNQALRQKYGVTLQTTFVKIDDQGNLVDKFVAYDEPTFESVKRNLL